MSNAAYSPTQSGQAEPQVELRQWMAETGINEGGTPTVAFARRRCPSERYPGRSTDARGPCRRFTGQLRG